MVYSRKWLPVFRRNFPPSPTMHICCHTPEDHNSNKFSPLLTNIIDDQPYYFQYIKGDHVLLWADEIVNF